LPLPPHRTYLSVRAGAWTLRTVGFQIICSRAHSHYKQSLTMMFIGLFTSRSFKDTAIITIFMELLRNYVPVGKATEWLRPI